MLGTPHYRRAAQDQGFTLVELMVVLAVCAFVTAELLSAGTLTERAGRMARCINNHRQLTKGWLMYADENNDTLVPNPNMIGLPGASPGWVNGILRWDFPPTPTNPDNTNGLKLSGALLGSYVNGDTSIYKCPSDVVNGTRGSRVRSVAMNGMMNGQSSDPISINQTPVAYTLFVKRSQIVNPTPFQAWVFTDEHADSINDGFFRVDMGQTNTWADLPASYHDGQGMFSYADGHVEPRRWVDGSIAGRPVTRINYVPFSASASPTDDLIWLQNRTTSLPGN